MKQLVVAGYPIGHSLSPIMHSAALIEMGLDEEYNYGVKSILENELESLVVSIHTGKLAGANVTIPYKSKIMEHIPYIMDEAIAVGSVNTLFKDGNHVFGCNTDVNGFNESIRENDIELKGRKVTILGSGGAAKAVAFAVSESNPSELRILSRTFHSAERLASHIRLRSDIEIHSGSFPVERPDVKGADLLINCTPIGMRGHSIDQSPINKSLLTENLVVMDLVYNPIRTRLLRDSKDVGCKTIDGTGMLVHQGAIALEIWTDRKAPVAVMKRAVLGKLGGK